MSRAHSYLTRFRCPTCKRAGAAKWEESGRTAGGEHVSILKQLAEGFHNTPQNQIECTACSARVVFGHG
jgi:DNA-directed RNA polymerase subunit RPC12/RpoP